jgi:hypothetical protein
VADLEAVRAKWRQVLQSTDDEATIERAHAVLAQLADADPKLAKHKAGMERQQEKVDDLNAQPDPTSFGEVVGAVGHDFAERGKALGRGVKAVATHPKELLLNEEFGLLPAMGVKGDKRYQREFVRGVDDAVMLGYGRVLAAPLQRAAGRQTFADTEKEDREAAPDVRAGGTVAGMFVPGPVNKVFGAPGKLIGPGKTVAREAARSGGRAVLGYGATAPAMAALHADGGSIGDRLEAARDTLPGGLAAGALGAAAGAAKKAIGGAPARAEESELGALKEGVQYKTRVRTYGENKPNIDAELAQAPEIRAAIKSNPVAAADMVAARLDDIASNDLDPIYAALEKNGRAAVPVELVTNQLKAVRGKFHDIAEEGPVAVIDRLVEKFEAKAAESNGALPAQYIRQASTAFQGQGNANIPMFGAVPLTKAMKQGVGNALRSAIGDHIESLADDTPTGQVLREAYQTANRRVGTWNRIQDIVDEKVSRIQNKAGATGDVVQAAVGAVKSPAATLGKAALGAVTPAIDILDRRVLGPAVRSGPGQALAPGASRAANAVPRFSLPYPGLLEEEQR